MKHLRIALVSVAVCLLVGLIATTEAKQGSGKLQIKSDEIGGVVTSSKGPEAGVWVIAETNSLPTKFIKIVVTDDEGRYLIPELPKASYNVWVRGYGLIDSKQVSAVLGKKLDLTAVIAPSPKDAAQYYPASYWFSLLEVPSKSEFPMKPTAPPAYLGQPTSSATDRPAGENMEALAQRGMTTQEQWIDNMKEGCQHCHQIGDWVTRDLTHLAHYEFKSSADAWGTRVHFGQFGGTQMAVALAGYVDQQRAVKMFSDWTDRIAAGALPPEPPRPQGVERNVVISMWDWGKPQSLVHDEISTDRRNPTMNANGIIYGADYFNDQLVTLDPTTNTVGSIPMPTRQDRTTMTSVAPRQIDVESPFWGKALIWSGVEGPHNPMMDQDGKVWVTATIRSPNDPDFCKVASDSPYAQYFPLQRGGKQASVYDPKTNKFTLVDTCFNTHHLQFGTDADNTVFFSPPGGQAFGWVNSRVLAETGDEKKAQGWCPAYLDTNGTGTVDPTTDKRLDANGYGIIVNPKDGAVWMTQTGTPGRLLRVTLGNNPPATCMAEVYEPPFNNPKMPGVFGYAPRGINVDRNGVIWTALSGSGQLASFDRSKCAVTSGPTATGQQCPEGWTLYTAPGPKLKGVTSDSSAEFEYYNWVDQFNTLGLGDNVPIVTGTTSDSLEAFLPDTKKWVVMRVPYPMGFYSRGMDGRIDNPNGGWKGRGVWASYGPYTVWHMEGGSGTLGKLVKFQIRPNVLAD